MDKFKRNERLAVMTKILSDAPNRIFTLSFFCEMFGAAKSTVSEDASILAGIMQDFKLGTLETVTGAAGGMRYRPLVQEGEGRAFLEGICEKLRSPGRVLPGGFLYFSDILSDPQLVSGMGKLFAAEYYDANVDFVLTMETKGIPVALMTSRALGVPLVIARRSSKVYEGSAVNINYVSGSDRHIETMSLSRRAVSEGQRALIVDDFLKGGGTAKGMIDLMAEFNVEVVGTAFVMSTESPNQRCIHDEKALMTMNVTDNPASLTVRPAQWLREWAGETPLSAE